MSMLKNYLGLGPSKSTSPPAKTTTDEEQKQHTVLALPASWYTSPEMYELERRAVFSRKWLLTTHELRLPKTGDWVRYEVAGFPFVVCRDRSGRIRAFHNVCRHRAFPVVTGESGNSRMFACKYHGWSYGLGGQLAKAPGYQDMEDFDRSRNGLFPIRLHVDGSGFIWVNLDARGGGDGLAEMTMTTTTTASEQDKDDDFTGVDVQEERLAEYRFDEYRFDHAWEMEGEYNWKMLADNYNECYHCKTAHPDIPSIADLEAYKVKTRGSCIEHYAHSTAEQVARGLKVAPTYFFPNASMNVTPNFFFIQRFVPLGPVRSAMKYEVYRHRDASDADFALISGMYRRIMAEDKELCQRAQRNLSAGVFVSGEMHPTMEKGPLFFQRKVREAVGEHYAAEARAGGGEIWPARQQQSRRRCGGDGSGCDDENQQQQDVAFCAQLECGKKREEGEATMKKMVQV